MSDHLLPCKKHGCLPRLRVIPLYNTFSQSIKLSKQEYYCTQCEDEALNRSFQRVIDTWNEQQTFHDTSTEKPKEEK